MIKNKAVGANYSSNLHVVYGDLIKEIINQLFYPIINENESN